MKTGKLEHSLLLASQGRVLTAGQPGEGTYWKQKLTALKIERFVCTKIRFDLGKNECHRPSGLGSR